jgi:transposase
VSQLKEEAQGIAPKGSAISPEQQKIQELETKIKRIGRENEILKKATALLMSDSIKSLI